jgi:hypothetical protein
MRFSIHHGKYAIIYSETMQRGHPGDVITVPE